MGFEEFSEALLHLKAEHDGLDPASRNFGLPDISPDKAGISIGDIVVAGVIGLVGMTIQVMTTNRMMLTMFQIAMGMSLSLNSLTMAQSVQQILDCVLLLVVHHLGRQHFVQFLNTLNSWILSFWTCCVGGDCLLLPHCPLMSGVMFWQPLVTNWSI